jgi:hypothetical protein
VAGENEAAASIASAMPRWVHPLGFVPDRRSYRHAIRLARVTPDTQLSYLESLAERLAGYEGPAWTVDSVSLASVRAATDTRPEVLEVFDELSLQDPRPAVAEAPSTAAAAGSVVRLAARSSEPIAAARELSGV